VAKEWPRNLRTQFAGLSRLKVNSTLCPQRSSKDSRCGQRGGFLVSFGVPLRKQCVARNVIFLYVWILAYSCDNNFESTDYVVIWIILHPFYLSCLFIQATHIGSALFSFILAGLLKLTDCVIFAEP
jgi:hypothetical protein